MSCAPWGCFYNGEIPSMYTDLGYMARRLGHQVIPTGVETLIDWTTIIEENPAGTFDLVADQFVCTIPGRYVFSLWADITVTANGHCQVRIYYNTNLRAEQRTESDLFGLTRNCCSVNMKLQVGDIMQGRVFQNSGANANLIGGDNLFTGALISR